MIDIATLKDDLAKKFEDVDENIPGIFKCKRRYSEKDISYYYIDYSQRDFTNEINLKKLQDDLLGLDYFANTGSIQWNYYLLFLYDDAKYESLISNKELVQKIENNKQYARKFILRDKEINDFFDFDFFARAEKQNITQDLSTKWFERLSTIGLGDICNNKSRASVIKDYLDGTSLNIKSEIMIPGGDLDTKASRISELVLKNYRPHPIRKEYIFGRMNLFVGPNGVGKTSLMEAIELCYAGATLRSGGEPDLSAELNFKYDGEVIFRKYEKDNKKTYQAKDLAWYGRSVTRGNSLFENFNKYNFFNTDSAFAFANNNDESSINSAFSSLALGEAANYVDKRLADFQDDFAKMRTSQSNIIKKCKKEISDQSILLKSLENNSSVSKSIYDLVRKTSETLGLAMALPDSPDLLSDNMVDDLLHIQPKALAAIEGNTLDFADTINGLVSIKIAMLELKNDFDKNNNLHIQNIQNISNQNTQKKYFQDQLILLERFFVYTEKNRYPTYIKIKNNIKILNKELEPLEKIAALFLSLQLVEITYVNIDKKPLENLESIKLLILKLKEKIKEKKKFLSNEKEKLGLIEQVTSEVIAHTRKLLEIIPHLQDCPICSSHFNEGELTRKVMSVSAETKQSNLTEMINEINQLEASLFDYEKSEKQLIKVIEIVELASQLNIPMNIDLSNLADSQAILELNLKNYKSDLNLLIESLNDLERFNLNEEEYNTLVIKLNLNELDLAEQSVSSSIELNRLQKLEIEKNIKEISDRNISLESERSSLVARFHLLMNSTIEFEANTLKTKINELEMRLNHLEELKKYLFLENNSNLLFLKENVHFFHENLKEYLIVKSEEKSKLVQFENSKKKLLELQEKIKIEENVLIKIEAACDLIDDILLNDGKDKALRDFISENRGLIDKIFLRIHSPKEFSGLANDSTRLIRKETGKSYSLAEVSTGQRAALAISIFIALNLSLKNAPPVLLIDDPVAHIDDLNILSFLDFLREIVMKTNRQIFFATANQKLATLIQKKFSFLEEDFKTYEFER